MRAYLLETLPRPLWYQGGSHLAHPGPGTTLIAGEFHAGLADARDTMAEFDIDLAALRSILVVVRNPYDWEVSLYNYLRQHRFGRGDDRLLGDGSFEGFVRAARNSPFPRFLWLDGRMPDNLRILRHESLQQDVEAELDRVGIVPQAVLPHLNRSTRPVDHRDYYSHATEAIVFERHRLLFEMGLYERMEPPAGTFAVLTPLRENELPMSGPVELAAPPLGMRRDEASARIRARFRAAGPVRRLTVEGAVHAATGIDLVVTAAGQASLRRVPKGPVRWEVPVVAAAGDEVELGLDAYEPGEGPCPGFAGARARAFHLDRLRFSDGNEPGPVSGTVEIDGPVCGIHHDGWVGRTLSLRVVPAGPVRAVRLRGTPLVDAGPARAWLRVDGDERPAESDTGREWVWALPGPLPAGVPLAVEIRAERTASPERLGLGADRRILWLNDCELAFLADAPPDRDAPDALPRPPVGAP